MYRLGLAALLAAGLGWSGPALAEEWLALCSKCLSPIVFSKTGIGTAHAVAQARITRQAAKDYCEQWEPGRGEACVAEQMATPEAKQTFRATADCTAGRITPVDGKTYRRDGVWPGGDIGAGRARFRDSAGRVVGRDNASGGLGIAQQWELLCPAVRPAASRPGVAAPAPPPAAPRAPAAAFRAGQTVEAMFGRQWIAGQVVAVKQVATPQGTEIRYEVVLVNRQRGVVPARMLRVPAP